MARLRHLSKEEYIFVGTELSSTHSGIGLVRKGNYSLTDEEPNIGVKCLNNQEFPGKIPTNTSIYGVNVLSNNNFNLVGTYNNMTPGSKDPTL